MSGKHLDLASDFVFLPTNSDGRPSGKQPSSDDANRGRGFVGIRFACCDVYRRIYRNREATAYAGHCPRCGRPITLKIGPGGTDARFFTAY